ncbi:hypothetical protein H9L39_02500 [Fusarium oxysporum f. sp. albedinis]|nr:hypothetical protein H9L39_02500 [Fusarium oxysporum f. sp. albedinis]
MSLSYSRIPMSATGTLQESGAQCKYSKTSTLVLFVDGQRDASHYGWTMDEAPKLDIGVKLVGRLDGAISRDHDCSVVAEDDLNLNTAAKKQIHTTSCTCVPK